MKTEKKQSVIKSFCKLGEVILDAKDKYEIKEITEEEMKRMENQFGKEAVRRATNGN